MIEKIKDNEIFLFENDSNVLFIEDGFFGLAIPVNSINKISIISLFRPGDYCMPLIDASLICLSKQGKLSSDSIESVKLGNVLDIKKRNLKLTRIKSICHSHDRIQELYKFLDKEYQGIKLTHTQIGHIIDATRVTCTRVINTLKCEAA